MDKKILVIGNGKSVLLEGIYKWTNKKSGDLSIDLFSLTEVSYKDKIFNKVYCFPSFFNKIKNPTLAFILKAIYLKVFTMRISGKYDVLHMHYIQNIFTYINTKKIANKSVITVWGSDFLRRDNAKRNKLRNLINDVDIVTCGNTEVLNKVGQFYNLDSKKLVYTPFGFEALDYIEKYRSTDKKELKRQFNFPEDAVCIALGYNADSGQQHEKIIASIAQNEKLPDLKERLFFVVPMTYGERSKGYINTIEASLKDLDFRYTVLKEFMDADTVARFRLACDILVQVQVTDLLAGSMQEHLCAENIVITGDWLPYETLKSRNIQYKEVSKVEETGDMLEYVINNPDSINTKGNYEGILKYGSWKYTISKWLQVYQ